MADTTLLLNGFSIIGDPQSTNSNASDGGNLMIHNGVALFEDDDIVVFQISGATADGLLTSESYVTGIVVYDSALDYYNDIALYTYAGTADIDTGRNNMGDRYLQLEASGLTSTDSGAPVLSDMAVVAGVNILATLEANNGPLVIPTNEDIDLNGDGVISPEEEADGTFSSGTASGTFVCFAKGTLIETPAGPVYIESLFEGDLVNTFDGGAQEIRWIGSRKVPGSDAAAPVEIAAGTLGNIRPLRVSQNHRMLVAGPMAELLFGQAEVLVAAKHLVNDDTIRIVPCEEITYYHILFDTHQIIFAEGCPAESLYPGAQALDLVDPAAREELIAIFPDLHLRETDAKLSRYALTGREAAALLQVA